MKTLAYRRRWKLIHNLIAHPLMEILPEWLGTWIHDKTAEKAFD